jgi:hypothetical protein
MYTTNPPTEPPAPARQPDEKAETEPAPPLASLDPTGEGGGVFLRRGSKRQPPSSSRTPRCKAGPGQRATFPLYRPARREGGPGRAFLPEGAMKYLYGFSVWPSET